MAPRLKRNIAFDDRGIRGSKGMSAFEYRAIRPPIPRSIVHSSDVIERSTLRGIHVE